MDAESPDQPNLPSRGVALIRLFWWMDRGVLWLGALPTMFVIQMILGGIRGFVIGLSAGMGVWFLYRAMKLILVRICARYLLGLDREVIAICNEAASTGDDHAAISRLDNLIMRCGETFDRVLALAGYLLSTNQMDRAMRCCDRAKKLAPPNQLWRVHGAEIELLRKLGRLQEAHDLGAHAVKFQPYSSGIRVEFAKVLSELGRPEEAEAQLREAKRLCSSRSLRFVVGKRYAQTVRKEVAEAEQLITRNSAPN